MSLSLPQKMDEKPPAKHGTFCFSRSLCGTRNAIKNEVFDLGSIHGEKRGGYGVDVCRACWYVHPYESFIQSLQEARIFLIYFIAASAARVSYPLQSLTHHA